MVFPFWLIVLHYGTANECAVCTGCEIAKRHSVGPFISPEKTRQDTNDVKGGKGARTHVSCAAAAAAAVGRVCRIDSVCAG